MTLPIRTTGQILCLLAPPLAVVWAEVDVGDWSGDAGDLEGAGTFVEPEHPVVEFCKRQVAFKPSAFALSGKKTDPKAVDSQMTIRPYSRLVQSTE